MSESRQLAAVLFTDIVGYSAIMQEDETAAVEKINRFRQALETKTPFFNGRIIQYYGDGCLLIFNSAVDAVGLAKDLQLEFSKEPQLPVRIGIHIGDILIKDGNVFGDAVNIAARIQALAPAGGILISEAVQKNIANKQNITTEYIKTEIPKNIKEPIRIYNVKTETTGIFSKFKARRKQVQRIKVLIFSLLLIAVFTAVYFIYRNIQKPDPPTAAPAIHELPEASLAVLPFTDNSATHDQEYLGDGIAEEILNVLGATMKDLKLPGRSSCFAFKGKSMDIKDVGKILNVKNILEGSVQKEGNRVSVRVYLNDAVTGNQVWAEKYDEELKDIFTTIEKVAEAIGDKLKLTFDKGNAGSASGSTKPEAVELALKGNFYFNKGDFTNAITYFEKSIYADSAYAFPYIRLGWTYYQMTLSGSYPSLGGFALAKNEIEKALQLNPAIADKLSAHRALAFINLWGYNWKKAHDEYDEFFAINPRRDMFNAFYQSMVLGNTDESVSIARKISEENPVDVLNLRDFAILQYIGRKYYDALQTCDKMLELDSTFSEAFRLKGHIYAAQNNFESALGNFNKAAKLGNQWGQILMLMTLPRLGQKENAQQMFAAAEKANPNAIPAMAKALVYYSFGETKKAMTWLNKSYEAKDFWLASLRVDPLWDPMRQEPEFQKLMKKMNFPQ